MQARMSVVQNSPDGYKALRALEAAVRAGGVPLSTLELVRIRASQINGCGFCLEMHNREARNAGVSEERLLMAAAWREASCFTGEERAALALTEAATRMSDRSDAVSDEVWDQAADHYDETQLAALIMAIAAINAWNRINVTVRQPAGVPLHAAVG
jgi:AhpD family alkylhydroperoxidase